MLKSMLIPAMTLAALAGCAALPEEQGTMVRLHNSSAYRLENVRVNFSNGPIAYGSLAPGARTVYREAGTAYRYAYIEAELNGQRVVLQPIDYVGETPLGPGSYTYRLTVNPAENKLTVTTSTDP